jgi:membrane-associated protease RseP (regulator of RpoE activity)
MSKKLAFIGVGNMATATLMGITSKEVGATLWSDIILFNRHPEKLESFKALGAYVANSLKEAVELADCVFLCVKPQNFPEILPLLADCENVAKKLFVSVAAGINTAIISQTGSYTGYSFAVPSNIVKKIAYDLMDFGSVKRAVLGIVMQPIDDKIAEELKLSSRNGVYINEVSKSGAADKAGLKAGDILTAIDSMKITNTSSVQEAVSRFSPGDKASVTVIRDGREMVFDVVFKGTSQENGTVSDDGTVAFYGSSIRSASKETLEKYGIKSGVEIVELGPGKLMEAGAVEGFIIQYVNDQQVKTPQDVIDIVKKSKRAVFVEGITPSGRTGYFGFGV